MQQGFSLVELSIVLVILGLLTGGILAGQSLIRAAELRAVTTQYSRYTTATGAFRDKYFALPGDMANAQSFWGVAHATPATCVTTAGTGTQTCNGDGDGNIEVSSTGSAESYRYWQHLANAGLIEGQYTGVASGAGLWDTTAGTNVPAGKLSNTEWDVVAFSDIAVQGGFYANYFPPASSTNWITIGGISSGNSFNVSTPVIKPEEAWNIDTKLDDGKPGTGKVTTMNTTQFANCASSNTASTATYQLSYSSAACPLNFGL